MSTRSTLNFWKHHLGYVPEAVCEQDGLEVMILANNDLTELPPKIARLQHLRTLDLGHNRLSAVPEALGQLTGLCDFLYLHDNRLTALPASLGHSKQLRYLNLSENAFQRFPGSRVRHGISARTACHGQSPA